MPSQFRVSLGSRLRASLACISGAIVLFAAARQSFLKSQTDLVKRFIKAYVEGIHRFKTDKTAALATLEKYTKQKTTPAPEKIYDVYASRYFKRARGDRGGNPNNFGRNLREPSFAAGHGAAAIRRVALYSRTCRQAGLSMLFIRAADTATCSQEQSYEQTSRSPCSS